MPDQNLYLKAIEATAIISTICVLLIAALQRFGSKKYLSIGYVIAISCGLAVGYYMLSLQLAWPPRNALERFLTLVLPAVLVIELVAGFHRLPNWSVWLFRVTLALILPRILLHDSVFLMGSEYGWLLWQIYLVQLVCGVLLIGLWALLSKLTERSPGVSISLAIQMSTLCAGLTVMMALYIEGGEAALPLVAALLATTIVGSLLFKRSDESEDNGMPVIIGVGVIGLFSILFIGRFFGELTTESALVILLAPLLCWVTEIPPLRNQKPWFVGTIRLFFVAIPLLVVLFLAKRDFDQNVAPLIVDAQFVPKIYTDLPSRTLLLSRRNVQSR
ncbi:MAG: hypothetical protein COA78_14630 [Blastopirellula sp.]|nr:MAG: hypothetical protein COA78_14630 [Blastopirellula sp.]